MIGGIIGKGWKYIEIMGKGIGIEVIDVVLSGEIVGISVLDVSCRDYARMREWIKGIKEGLRQNRGIPL